MRYTGLVEECIQEFKDLPDTKDAENQGSLLRGEERPPSSVLFSFLFLLYRRGVVLKFECKIRE
jgi:hypothetical protein